MCQQIPFCNFFCPFVLHRLAISMSNRIENFLCSVFFSSSSSSSPQCLSSLLHIFNRFKRFDLIKWRKSNISITRISLRGNHSPETFSSNSPLSAPTFDRGRSSFLFSKNEEEERTTAPVYTGNEMTRSTPSTRWPKRRRKFVFIRDGFFYNKKENKNKRNTRTVNARNRPAHVRLVPMYRSNKRKNGKPPLVTRHTETDEMIN